MKRFSTIIMRCAIFIIGIIALASVSALTFWVANGWAENPNHRVIMIVFIIGLYSSAVPFFIALAQAIKLLGYIDTNRAFSELSVRALKTIFYCAGMIFIACTVCGLPFFYYWAELDDAPGLVLVGMAIAGAAFVITVFASILKRLLQDAFDVKSENDLTI